MAQARVQRAVCARDARRRARAVFTREVRMRRQQEAGAAARRRGGRFIYARSRYIFYYERDDALTRARCLIAPRVARYGAMASYATASRRAIVIWR